MDAYPAVRNHSHRAGTKARPRLFKKYCSKIGERYVPSSGEGSLPMQSPRCGRTTLPIHQEVVLNESIGHDQLEPMKSFEYKKTTKTLIFTTIISPLNIEDGRRNSSTCSLDTVQCTFYKRKQNGRRVRRRVRRRPSCWSLRNT